MKINHGKIKRQRQVWLIQIADERVGVQVKLWNPLRTRPYVSASEMMFHEEALYQVYMSLPSPKNHYA